MSLCYVVVLLGVISTLGLSAWSQTAPKQDKKRKINERKQKVRTASVSNKAPNGLIGTVCSDSLQRGQKGQWCTVEGTTGTVVPIHMTVLPNGKVLYWGNILSETQTSYQIWDPESNSTPNQTFLVPEFFGNLFCSGHSFLPDGRLLITGGQDDANPNKLPRGIKKAVIFNYNFLPLPEGLWIELPDMNDRRWYPTNLTLGNGNILVWGGLTLDGNVNSVPQVLEKQPNGEFTWRAVNLNGGYPEVYNDFYSWHYLLSSGKIFSIVPYLPKSHILTVGDRFNYPRDYVYAYPINTTDQSLSGTLTDQHEAGSSVMYDKDEFIAIGGSDLPKLTAERINLGDASPSWSRVRGLNIGRKHFISTVLPDGKVLVTGGNKGNGFNNTCAENSVKMAELWDPADPVVPDDPYGLIGKWTELASASQPRIYHSSGVLLPDARVLTGGTSFWPREGLAEWPNGRPCAQNAAPNNKLEVFSPPYLFNADGSPATRPVISKVQSQVSYGETLTFTVTNAGQGSKVTLIRLPSMTHSFNQNQGISKLVPSINGQNFVITIPRNRNELTPGHYMLFVVSASGVPSVARIIQVL